MRYFFLFLLLIGGQQLYAQQEIKFIEFVECPVFYGDYAVTCKSNLAISTKSSDFKNPIRITLTDIESFSKTDFDCFFEKIQFKDIFIDSATAPELLEISLLAYPLKNKKIEKLFLEARVWLQKDSAFVRTYHGSNKKAIEGSFKNLSKKSSESANFYASIKPIGSLKKWNENGQLIAENNYNRLGQLHGKQNAYHANATLKEAHYYEAGQQVGKQQSWHSNGKLAEEAFYEKIPVCTYYLSLKSKIWDENGRLVSETKGSFEKGQMEYQLFHANGKLKVSKTIEFNKDAGELMHDLEEEDDDDLLYISNLFQSPDSLEAESNKNQLKNAFCAQIYLLTGKIKTQFWTIEGTLAAEYISEKAQEVSNKELLPADVIQKLKENPTNPTEVEAYIAAALFFIPRRFPNEEGHTLEDDAVLSTRLNRQISKLGACDTFYIEVKDFETGAITQRYLELLKTNTTGSEITLERYYPSGQQAFLLHLGLDDQEAMLLGEENSLSLSHGESKFWSRDGSYYRTLYLTKAGDTLVEIKTNYQKNSTVYYAEHSMRLTYRNAPIAPHTERIDKQRAKIGKIPVSSYSQIYGEIPKNVGKLDIIYESTLQHYPYQAKIKQKTTSTIFSISTDPESDLYQSCSYRDKFESWEYYESGKLNKMKNGDGTYEYKEIHYDEQGKEILHDERKSQ